MSFLRRLSPVLSVLASAFLIVALFATACSSDPDGGENTATPGAGDGSGTATSDGGAEGVRVQIDGPGPADTDTTIIIGLDNALGDDVAAPTRETTVLGDPLGDSDVQRLLDRLPDLVADAADQVDFNRPPDTRPRPRPGTTVDQQFPPPGEIAAPQVERGPLEVLRFQPEGPVDLAPFISITFNKPMVALSTVSQVEAADVPITITPEMPGRWIWLGTRTVRFEYEPGAIDRIPAATNYVVEVPAGSESANGDKLAEAVRFEFSTPTPRVVDVVPMNTSLSTEPLFFIRFDQRVNPVAVLGTIDLSADGRDVAIRLATGDEVNEDTQVAQLAESALPERWLAIRPVEPLPTNAAIELAVGPNTPSAEGPEISPDVSTFNGRTYGPFRVVAARCDFGDGCQPGQSFSVEMTNPIDTTSFTANMVSVEPAIPGMQIGVSYNTISIQGRTKGRTTYDITVGADLTDIYGQQLGDAATASIDVGDANPGLFSLGRSLVTLDPIIADNRLNVTSINNDELDLTVYQVDPKQDWTSYFERGWEFARGEFKPGWKVLSERRIKVDGEANTFAETAIDLSDELAASGHVVAVLSPTRVRDDEWQNQPFAVWVQNTTLGLDAVLDNDQAVAWVTDLRTGEPIEGASVSLIGGASATTDGDGIARLALSGSSRGMFVEANGESGLIGDFWADSYPQTDQTRWYVTDDRGIYKPGETARLKGFVRLADADVPAKLSLPNSGSVVTWSANDAFGNQIGSGEATLSSLGGFDIAVELPDDITLGSASVQFDTNAFGSSGSGGYWRELRVQEFRRPDFEVAVSIADPGPYLAQEPLRIDAAANYFAGGPLAGSPLDWSVTGSASSYSPPDWPEYTFGIWVPWWFAYDSFGGRGLSGDTFFGGGFGDAGTTEVFSATTDPAGDHGLAVTISTEGKPRPVSITASATVTDVNRQPITGSTTALVHPADLYVGLRGSRNFVAVGERLDLDVIVTDIDGAPVSGRSVTVVSNRIEWQFQNGQWTEVEVVDDTCEITSDSSPVICQFRPSEGGQYRISATVTDDADRTNLTELTRWVAGGDAPPSRGVDLEQLTLVPDGQNYQPGDTAEILVQSPFVDAHGLLVVTRGGIDRTETFDFDDAGTAIVRIPITSDDIPGIGVQLEVVGTAPRTSDDPAADQLPLRPAYASGQITLNVPPDERTLTVAVAPRLANVEPGAATQVDVAVTGPDGNPVADAELAVIIVDEAVLSLTGYQLQNPLDQFYARNGGYLQNFRGRATLLLSDPAITSQGQGGDIAATDSSDSFAVEESAADAGGAALRSAPAPTAAFAQDKAVESDPAIDLRTNFDALAVFEPNVRTDRDGKATIDVPLPHNLTRYRIMVIATADATDAGTGESNLTARLPVTVRPTPPRFANFGDVFEFPVVVQNATDDDLEVDVALRSTNLSVDGRSGTTVTVPANDRVEVRFEVSAVEAGTARYQVAASAGSFSDAADGEFPVYTPATAEAFATYGVVDSGSIAQPFNEPTGVFPQFGGLEISTSSTAVAALTDAVLYLSEYRYESSDAYASRIMAVVSLDDILEAFDAAELPSPASLRSVVNNDIDRLASMQNGDGGFPYWRRGFESIPYNSVQATHALVLADQNGFTVGPETMTNALAYLADIESHYPSFYDEKTRQSISAYALHVRFLAGDLDINKARALYDRAGDGIELDVAALLWPILADTEIDDDIELLLNNRVTETPNAATFATSYNEQAWVLLVSDRRTDAVVLDALVRQRPASDLVLKTLNGLLAARDQQGHWSNVQENSFVLLAASAYFHAFEDVDPNFVARAWLGDTYAVEHTYDRRSTDRTVTLVPMADLVGGGDTDIVLAKDGTDGRLYYRLGLRYAPTDFDLAPRDQGFVVQRSYEAIDDEGDVVRNDDGTWTVKAGARVRVRLTMVADSRRTHVALIDPIPAGFEIVNPALATSEPTPQADPSETAFKGYWWYQWFDHQNLRDDRAEAFSTWLGAGSYEYTYIARATTPGTFVTPPARAEQIYEPEVFGRSASTTVEIIDP